MSMNQCHSATGPVVVKSCEVDGGGVSFWMQSFDQEVGHLEANFVLMDC
jgi:hypothetical protein